MSEFDTITARLGDIGAKTLFFVCGSMKSGNTWLQILLDPHPEIICGGEGHFTDKLAPILQDAVNQYGRYIGWKNAQKIGGLDGYPRLGQTELIYLIRTTILLLFNAQTGGKAVAAIGEKTPDSIMAMPLLDLVFPEARFIHLVRDGCDCAASGWFHNQRMTPDWQEKNFPTLESYAAATATATATATEWAHEQRLAASFTEARPERCLTLRYEDLVDAPAGTFATALDFLGVDHDPATVAACHGRGAFASLSGGRAAGEENRGSFFRKGVAGDWRNHFSAEANSAFIREAGLWLAHFGYPE